VYGFSNTFIPLDISPKMRLNDVVRKISNLPFQSTDCALPMLYAQAQAIEVDTFCIYTDNETGRGACIRSRRSTPTDEATRRRASRWSA